MKPPKGFFGSFLPVFLFLIACGFAASLAVAQTTVNATTTIGGNWTAPGTWTCNPAVTPCVPNNGMPAQDNYNVVVNPQVNNNSDALLLDSSSSLSSVTINTLDIASGYLQIYAGRSLTTTQDVTNAGSLIAFPGSSMSIQGSLNNTGTLSAAAVSNEPGPVISVSGNLANSGTDGLIDLQGGASLTVAGMLVNDARVLLNSSDDILTVGGLTNVDAIGVGAGTLALRGSGTNDSGSALNLGGGVVTGSTGSETLVNGGVMEGSGTIKNLALTNNYEIFAGTAPGLGGTLDIAANLTNLTNGTLSGGDYDSFGTLQLPGDITTISGALVSVDSSRSQIIDGAGKNALSSLTTIQAGGNLGVYRGATLATSADLTLKGFNSGIQVAVGGSYVLSGTLNVTDGGYITVMDSGSTLNVNGNLVNASSAQIVQIEDGGTLDASSISNSGIVVTGNSPHDTGDNTITVAGTLTNSGFVMLEANGDTAVAGALDNSDEVSLANGTTVRAGSLANSGDVSLNGLIEVSGSYSQRSGTTAVNNAGNFSAALLVNDANSNFSVSDAGTATTLSVNNAGTLTVWSGGAFRVTNGGAYTQTAGKTTVSTGGSLVMPNDASVYDQIGGATDVDGTLMVPTVNINGGTLSGTGTIQGNVTIGANGILSPGDAPGTIHIAGPLTLDGTLAEAIDSISSFDVTDIAGGLTLGSNSVLDIMLGSGFDPTVGTSFTIMDVGSLNGTFGSILNDSFNNGAEDWTVAYNSNDIVLTAAARRPTPEPASLFLFGTGLLGMAWALRRRRAASN